MNGLMIKSIHNRSTKPIKDGDYKRSLKDRHVQLIALGGIIGSGYFLGTGEVINQVGPSACLGYIFGGLIVFLVMLCMGELSVAIPISGSFVTYTADLISPRIACGVGWSYWISWVVYIPAECIAGGIIMEYFTGINGYVWAVLFGLIITYINITKVSMFGEFEFWLALIKIIALMIFVVIAILIFFGFIHGDQPSEIIGRKFIFDQGGLFPNGIPVMLTIMVLLLVNYQGSEIVGLAAGESVNPSKMIPHAIRNVTLRILFIYIVPVFCLVLIFPWYKANLDHIVFADALNYYGLPWAGTIASFVTLTAAISCANSGLYGIVRALNALAREGMAPSKLALLNHNGVPQNAVIVTLVAIWLVIVLAYFLGQSAIYVSLLLVSGFTGLMAWISICWAQINFRKRLYKAGYTTGDLKFKTPLSPYTGIIAIALMTACLIFLLLNDNHAYKIAFVIGITSFVIPVTIHMFHTKRINYKEEYDANRSLRFKDIFPKRP